MRDILKSTKSLSDQELKKLIKSLQSLLDKRNKARLQKAYELEARERAAEEVKQKITEIAAEKGVSLEQLGFALGVGSQAATIKRRVSKMKAEKQWYQIDSEGLPQLLFTRQIKQFKAEGLALSFGELSQEQQTLVRALVDARNEKN